MSIKKQKYLKDKDLFKRPTASDKATSVYIIDPNFLKSFNYWLENSNSKAPTSDVKKFDSLIDSKINPKLGTDFEILSRKAYELIKDDFKLGPGKQKYYVKDPATGQPSVLFNATKISINMLGTPKHKYCSKDWRVSDVKNQVCIANGLDPNAYKLVEEGKPNKNVDNQIIGQIISRKFKLIESNDLSTSLKSSKLSTSTNNSAKTSTAQIHEPTTPNTSQNNSRGGSRIPVRNHSTSSTNKNYAPTQTTSNRRITQPVSGTIKSNTNKHTSPSPQPPIITPKTQNHSNNTNNQTNTLSTAYGNPPSGIIGGSIGNSHTSSKESKPNSSQYKKEPLPSLPEEINPPKSPATTKRTPSRLSSDFSKSTGLYEGLYPRPVGLHNLGNTCFFNSAVQCLIRVKPLTDFIMSSEFESQINERNKKGSKGRIARAYRNFIKLMSTGKSAQDPSDLRSAIISKFKRFNNYSQHDSQELLGALLDGLHEDFNQAHAAGGNQPEIKVDENTDSWTLHISKNYSPIVDIFHGEFFSNTECPSCNYISSVHDPFMFMSVPIPSKLYGKVKLTECLRSFEQVDKLDEDNKWECGGCHKKVCATKRMGIYRCAKILIIHLKRFSGGGYFSSKIETEVDYPDVLDTSPFVSEGHGAKYQLIGAVFHSGSLGGGHYTSAALDQVSDKWYNFNDSFASPIDISSAHSRSAYIIFYQRM